MTYQRQCQDEAGTRNAAPASRPFNHELSSRTQKIDKSRNPDPSALLERLCFRHTRRALLPQSRACCSPMQQSAALQRSSKQHTLPFRCSSCIEVVSRLIYHFQYSRIGRERSLKSMKATLTVVAMLHMIDDGAGSKCRHDMPETREPMSSPLPHAALGEWGALFEETQTTSFNITSSMSKAREDAGGRESAV
jgi:hypothetical protein